MTPTFNKREALRDGKEVIIEMVPPEHQEHYLKRREGSLVDSRNKARVPGLDREIIPNKYYPMFYDEDDTPTIVPQGWFYYNIGLRWWQFKIGTEKLENFFLIKGEEAITNQYAVKRYFRYGNLKIWVNSKIIFPQEIRYANSRKSFKKKLNKLAQVSGDTILTERQYFNTLFSILGEKFSPGFSGETIRNYKLKNNGSRTKKKRP